ncbi:hypothetical protein HPB47_004126, partial [Ixodes persulcatus]
SVEPGSECSSRFSCGSCCCSAARTMDGTLFRTLGSTLESKTRKFLLQDTSSRTSTELCQSSSILKKRMAL